MRISILTLNPGFFDGPLGEGMIRIAREKGIVDIADWAMILHVGHVAWTGAASDLDQATLEASYFGGALDR